MDDRSVPVPDGNRETLTVLVRRALGLSHRQARELIRAGRVVAGAGPVLDPAWRPPGGTAVRVLRAPLGQVPAAPPLTGPGFRVVYVDRDLAAADKEPGLLVVPTGREGEETPLVARVAAALALTGRRTKALWVVHRIDRETSGLVLFARTPAAFEGLSDQFRERRPVREYLAITEGIPEPREGVWEDRLVEEEDPPRRVRLARGRERGRVARLRFRVERERERPPTALVRVWLETGRRNQIRVQFASRGWPLLGDRFYGARRRGTGRTALHAARLGFLHPRTGRRIELEAPLAPDLSRLVERLWPR
ncbi:MAG: RluA family pseudouridine synthase [Acidobacteria bacterium]|nr:MAG: RluA family pseudouridine synthase [Acidobacteriota bacterium]